MLNSLGIMSGTSLDGLDISLIKSNGENKIIPIYNITYKYSQEFKDEIGLFIKFVNTVEPLNIKNLKNINYLKRKLITFFLKKLNSLCMILKFQIILYTSLVFMDKQYSIVQNIKHQFKLDVVHF